MLQDVLCLGPGVYTDVLYLNKAGTLACGFDSLVDGTVIKNEFEIAGKKSLL